MNPNRILISIAFGIFRIFCELRSSFSSDPVRFCYKDASCGPGSSFWSGTCQTGTQQSPIDLPKDWKTPFSYLVNPRSLNFQGYSSPAEFYIWNTGHGIQVSFNPNFTSSARMTGDGFSVPYFFAQAHFHWGESTSIGSEHTINGKAFPMELHLVHYSSKYSSLSEATASGDSGALAVLGVFIKPFTELSKLTPFNSISQYLPTTYRETEYRVHSPLDFSKFLPRKGDGFYRYNGSLTTPSCNEQVIWTVLAKPFHVRFSDYRKFQETKNEQGELIGRNFRPIRPTNGRKVEYFRKK
jgi:carbonic anhydrase